MAAYVACNAKYYKKSNWKGLSGHVHRQFENDENVRPELSHENFGRQFADLPTLEQRMMEAKQAAGLRARGFQADANVVLDNVLILSRERVEALKSANPDGYKADILAAAVALSERVRDEYGLEPMGIQFHWDEGHENKDGQFVHNYHAHMQFFNFDFKKLNQPLRRMKRGDFSKLQDLAVEAYAGLGFERGQSKKITKNNHLEKRQHVAKKTEENISNLQHHQEKLKESISYLANERDRLDTAATEMKKELKYLENRKLTAIEEQKILQIELEKIRGQLKGFGMTLFHYQRMGDALEKHRSDFEAFLASTPNQVLAERLKCAEDALRAIRAGKIDPIDDYIENYQNSPLKPR